jgi:hypothetical protein
MLPGFITKQEGTWWSAAVPAIGVVAKGRSLRVATLKLKHAVLTAIDRKSATVSVRQRRSEYKIVQVAVRCDPPTLLALMAVRYARDMQGWDPKRTRALRRLLLAAAKPRPVIKPVLRRFDTKPVQNCENATIPHGALRLRVSDLCRRAGVVNRSTYDRPIYVYRGTRKIHTLAFDIVGVPVSPRSREGALRALESLAYSFHEHHARHCIIGRGYFTTRSPNKASR